MMNSCLTNYKYVCPLPFMHVAFGANGDFRVCCNALHGEGQGHLRKSDGSNYNIARDKIGEHVNADLLKEIRKSMLNDLWHPECKRCMDEEKAGLKSRRITESDPSEIFHQRLLEYIEATDLKTGEILEEYLPIDMDLRFGNKCNLKCRMCSPSESDSWYEDHVKLFDTQKFHVPGREISLISDQSGKYRPSTNEYEFINNDYFWKNIDEFSKNLKRIYIVGGEPLIIEKHFQFLKKCVELGHAKNITLEYNTNLTIFTDEMIEIWRSFKRVDFGVSIDGAGKINDYIRYPSRWDKVSKNLKKLNELCQEEMFNGWLATTVSVFNIVYLKDLINWLFDNSIYNLMNFRSPKPILKIHMLKKPSMYCVQSFLKKSKKDIEKQLFDYINSEFLNQIKEVADKKCYLNFKSEIAGAVEFMYLKDQSIQKDEFHTITKRLDEIRDQSIFETLPELMKYI